MMINIEKWKYSKIIIIIIYPPTSEILNPEKKIVEIEFFFFSSWHVLGKKVREPKNKKEVA